MRSADLPDEVNDISRLIIGAALEVHRTLGAGLYESVYQTCFLAEMLDRGLRVQREVAVPIFYKGRRIEAGFRADFVVNEEVVVEVKAVDMVHRAHEAQILTYTNGGNFALGLLFNFHAPRLMPGGFRRIAGRSARR